MSPAASQRILFGLHRWLGSDLERHYREFLALSEGTGEQVRSLQDRRLEEILAHAAHRIPFYRRRVNPGDGLEQFPILTKNDIRLFFNQLKASGLLWGSQQRRAGVGYSWVEVKTGGTTGLPITVIHDKEFRDRGRASRMFSRFLCGFPYGTPYYYLWGSVAELNDQSESLIKRLDHALAGTAPLNAFRLDEAHCRTYLQQMVSSPRRHLMAYVDAADTLARFGQRHRLPLPSFESIMACAGMVHEDIRKNLAQNFSARIHNKYGSRECTDMVCENSAGELLVYANHVVLEVVDDQGHPVAEGQSGRILVTLLGNKSFPMIRYEIGDMAVQGRREGRTTPFPTLAAIEGRISDFITSTNGDYVSPVMIRHLVGVVHGQESLEKYQFIQHPGGLYELKMQLDPSMGSAAMESLRAGLHRDLLPVLGAGARLEVQRTDRLAAEAGGKYRYVINLAREAA